MDVVEQIKRFNEFIETSYKAELLKRIRKDEKFLVIDFNELAKFDIELTNLLLEQPEEVIKAVELAIEQMDIENVKGVKARFKNLPESQKIKVSDIRSKHLGSLIVVEGVVRQKSDVRPQVTSARFECPSCGNIINVLQLDSSFKEPSRCGCGRKGKFRLVSKELVDAQGIVLEESPESLEGGEQPKRMNIFLKDDLVSPISEKRTSPGSKIIIVGQIKEVPIILRTGSKSTRFDLMIEANYVEGIEESFYDVKITEEEEKQIKEISESPNVYRRLIDSMAPSIYGYDKIKEALLLQLIGGVRKTRKDGVISRGDMHVLLVGDPGSGKSALLKRINLIAPKGRYVSGKGVSGAGITASVVKDEFLKGWSLEAGALVLANNGLCCTTGDSEIITEDHKKIRFEELFKNANKNIIYPKFKVLALNTKNNKIEAFKIKRAFKIKNKKGVYKIKTRTGREINLTEDNEILTVKNSKELWIETGKLKKGDHIAVPNNYPSGGNDNHSEEFAYVCGLIASDGSIKIDNRHAHTNFYNTNTQIISVFKKNLDKLKVKYNTYIQKRGRKGIIRGKKILSKKNLYIVYNCRKEFAKRLINFGVPKGNKSTENPLNKKILSYSTKTLSSFMRGIFDGDGSIRKDPYEISLTTGLKENAKLFQEILLKLGIISSIKISTNSWHCDIRGMNECIKFFNLIGTSHPSKFEKISKMKAEEVKDRINILPNHQKFFKHLIKRHRWKLGKDIYKYLWNYTKKNVCPSIYKLSLLNRFIQDKELANKIDNDVLWDKIISIRKVNAKYVYDFTMNSTNNFIANGVIMHNCIDEMDKMSPEDRGAMHEAMEQQCMLPDFKLMLSNGNYVKIGEYIDRIMEQNKDKIIKGKDCEILEAETELISTDFQNSFNAKASKISRHLAPKKFVKIKLTNGRVITVTPEHPCWIIQDGKILTKPAEEMTDKDYFPVPSQIDIQEKEYKKENDLLCKILGYHISDGCYELNRGKKNGIQFWNNDKILIEDYKRAIEDFFKIKAGITKRKNQFAVRVVSNKVTDFMKNLDESLLEKGIIKKIPNEIIKLPKENIKYLLRSLFDGDGTVVFEKRNGCRISLSAENITLSEQVSDLLLRFGITSSIFQDKNVFKVDISGQDNLLKFLLNVSFLSQKKKNRLKGYCDSDKTYRTIRDITPGCTEKINKIFKELHISAKKEIGHSIDLGVEKQRKFLQKLVLIAEKFAIKNKNSSILKDINELKKLAFGFARWVKIKEVSVIDNKDIKWVYDVTVEPNHTFVSNGMILHNTVSISKANIQATLLARTTVLAAANPKFGRFDPYGIVADQIDLPPTLINRFDLIFTIKDLPDETKDTEMASHILNLHQTPDIKEPEIPSKLLKKYIAYARQNINPQLTDGAIEEIKNYYVKMRLSGGSEEGIKTIPISARQLEALVRLSEASARVRLQNKVTRKDAKKAIELLEYCLMGVGFDKETGKIDIDRIATGISATQRSQIGTIKEVISDLENKIGKTIPIDDIVGEAREKGIDDERVEEILQKLKQTGDIFEPKRGFIQKM